MTLEEAQAKILEQQEKIVELENEKETLSKNNEKLKEDNEKIRTLNQKYFNKLSQQVIPDDDEKKGKDEPEQQSLEDYAKTLNIF